MKGVQLTFLNHILPIDIRKLKINNIFRNERVKELLIKYSVLQEIGLDSFLFILIDFLIKILMKKYYVL